MVNLVGGYLPSSGNLGIEHFAATPGLIKLANNNQDYIIDEHTPISDQGPLNSCVANATADAFEILKGVEDPNTVEQISRLFIYWNARVYTNDTDKDFGTFIHNALDSLTRLGVCRESVFPYVAGKVYTQPPIKAYREGNDNTINTFYQIVSSGSDRLNEIEVAVKANHPVIFGTAVDSSFQNYSGNNKTFDPPKNSIGNHAMIVVGVRRTPSLQFYVRNSWGSNWGDNGHAWLSADYLMSSQTSDLFVPTRIDNLLI